MTAAQFVFAFCGIVFVPVSSFIICRNHLAENKPRPQKTKRILWGLLFVCGVIAKACFPDYPVAPSEPVAVSFTLPVLLVAFLIAWRSTNQNNHRLVGAVSMGVVYLIGLGVAYQLTVAPERKALPWNAKIIHESYWADGFLPDYDYSMTASIRQDEFEEYTRRLDLKLVQPEALEHFKPEKHSSNVYANEWEQGGTYAWLQDGLLHVHSFRM